MFLFKHNSVNYTVHLAYSAPETGQLKKKEKHAILMRIARLCYSFVWVIKEERCSNYSASSFNVNSSALYVQNNVPKYEIELAALYLTLETQISEHVSHAGWHSHADVSSTVGNRTDGNGLMDLTWLNGSKRQAVRDLLVFCLAGSLSDRQFLKKNIMPGCVSLEDASETFTCVVPYVGHFSSVS